MEAARNDRQAQAPFRRAKREDALDLAIETFRREERVDMQTLAAQLGIGRTTLYRWVGDREQLLAEVLASHGGATWTAATKEARGTGLEHALSAIRNFIVLIARFAPARAFAQREPALALKLLLSRAGPLAGEMDDGMTRVVQEATGAPMTDRLRAAIETATEVSTAMLFGSIIAGLEPDIDRTIHVVRDILETAV